MFNLTGKCKIFNIEENEKFIKCSVMTSKKDRNGEWENEFYNAVIVGKGIEDYVNNGIVEKDKIEITNGVIVTDKYEGKNYPKVTIFALKKQEETENQNKEQKDKDSKSTPSWKKSK